MKIKLLILITLLIQNAFSQKVKIETGDLNVDNDFKCVISKVFNGKVYTCAFQNKRLTVVGFEVSTMKQVSSFTTEKIKHLIPQGVLFLENKIVILHSETINNANMLGDVFSYDGKNILTDFELYNFGETNSYRIKHIVSQNGKYFMLSNTNYMKGATFEYGIFDVNIKFASRGNIKLPRGHNTSYIDQLILSNTGNIGIFSFEEDKKNTFSYLKLNKGSKIVEEIKIISTEYHPILSKLVSSNDGYFFGGIYGTRGIQGAFGFQLDLDSLNLIYSNLTDFTDEQGESYNTELKKHPNYKKGLEKIKDTKIMSRDLKLRIDGITIDKNKNIIFGLSSFHSVDEYNKFATNIIICQFRLNANGGMSNYIIIPKRHTNYNDAYTGSHLPSDYFYSSIVCSGNHIVSIFNDQEKNISNLTDMNLNVSGVDKKSLLASVETTEDGKFEKNILLPDQKDILIMTEFTLLIDHDLTFAIGTRDKGNVVLLKIISN
ncbi:MAG: hypothetical protein PSX81_08765 [bacterium]|nr:hypothetical protein [bacterium]